MTFGLRLDKSFIAGRVTSRPLQPASLLRHLKVNNLYFRLLCTCLLNSLYLHHTRASAHPPHPALRGILGAMIDPPPRPAILNNYAALVSTLSSFLTVSIHTLLYERGLYPASSFISARAYRFPVRQSRHPEVCEWINDAVSACEKEIAAGRVERVSFVIYDIGGNQNDKGESKGGKDAKVVERWVFDIGSWPVVSSDDRLVEFEEDGGRGKEIEAEKAHIYEADEEAKSKIRMVDIEEQLRGTIRKLGHTAERMPKLPEECTYTLAVELRDEAEPPIGHPQPWVPSEPSLQTTKDKGTGKSKRGPAVGGAKSIPVRVVESGAFVLETWVEEAK